MSSLFRLGIAVAILAGTSAARADVIVSAAKTPSGITPQTVIHFGSSGTGLSVVSGTANDVNDTTFTFTPNIPVNAASGAATIEPASPAAAYSQLRIDIEAGYGFSGFEFNFDGILSAGYLRIEAIDEFGDSHFLSGLDLTLNTNGQNKFAVEATGGLLTSLILTATPNSNGTGQADIISSFKQPRVNGIAELGGAPVPPLPPPPVSEVPEPASLAIWGCVVAGLAATRLRNRRKPAE